MQITTNPEDGYHLVRLVGDFDTGSVPEFEAAVAPALRAKPHRVVLDLAETSFASSTALGSILRAAEQLRNKGGGLVMARLCGVVNASVRTLRVDTRIPCCDTIEAAQERLLTIR